MPMPLVGSLLTLLRARLSPHCMYNLLTPTLHIHCPFHEHSTSGALAYWAQPALTVFFSGLSQFLLVFLTISVCHKCKMSDITLQWIYKNTTTTFLFLSNVCIQNWRTYIMKCNYSASFSLCWNLYTGAEILFSEHSKLITRFQVLTMVLLQVQVYLMGCCDIGWADVGIWRI